jgi:hypothetical protein
MEDIINLIATGGSPSEISDAIKNSLYVKSAEKIEFLRPEVANSLFGSEESESEVNDED